MSTKAISIGVLVAVFGWLGPLGTAHAEPSDGLLTIQVEKQLREDSRLRDAELKVHTVAGVVKLKGSVESHLDRIRAERLCKKINGVRGVESMIQVHPAFASDDQIVRDIEARWKEDRMLRLAAIEPAVHGSTVTIRGQVEDPVQKRRAEQLVREVRGVLLIKNEIELRELEPDPVAARSDRDLEREVLAALRRDAQLAQLPIAASATRGKLSLSGAAANLYEKERAGQVARTIPGVKHVENGVAIGLLPDLADDVPLPPMEQIVRQVHVQLEAATRLDASQIDVTYIGDLLVLQGSVPNLSEKLLAANTARRVTGVRGIANKLTVAADVRDDAVLRRAVRNLLSTDVILANESIEVVVDRGAIVLSGHVESFGNKRRAVHLTARTNGVRSIQNRILVAWSPQVSDDGLKKRIEAKLKKDARTKNEAGAITVHVADGVVTLKGHVSDDSTRRTIHDLAANTDCVRRVASQLGTKPPR